MRLVAIDIGHVVGVTGIVRRPLMREILHLVGGEEGGNRKGSTCTHTRTLCKIDGQKREHWTCMALHILVSMKMATIFIYSMCLLTVGFYTYVCLTHATSSKHGPRNG